LSLHTSPYEEIVQLLAAARQMDHGQQTPQPMKPCLACGLDGLRVSEAIHLLDADVDLKLGMLTIRQTKFRQVAPVTDSSNRGCRVDEIRRQRARHVATIAEMPFLISSVAGDLGNLSQSSGHRVFKHAARQSELGKSWLPRSTTSP